MELVGYILLSSLFLLAAYNHILDHNKLVKYAESTDFPFPYVAGWPAGLYLLGTGVALFVEPVVGLWLAISWLFLTAAFFHRNMEDPGLMKNVALIGASLALISAL